MSYADWVNDQSAHKAFRLGGTGLLTEFYLRRPAPRWRRKRDDMYTLSYVRRKAQAVKKNRMTGRRAMDRAQVLGAAVGLFGGVASGGFGAVFTATSWFVANEGARRWLSTAGATLLFLTIPLLIIGGYCMDWLEKDRPRRGHKVLRYENEDDDEGQ